MKTATLFKNKKVFSFEVFPPKKTASIDTIYKTLDQLNNLQPDFISVTYGAAGNQNKHSTLEIASAIKKTYNKESVAHLTGINLTKKDVLSLLQNFKKHHLENILALRGDINPDIKPQQDFKYASELIEFIKQNGKFNIIAACYPEGHYETSNRTKDLQNLKNKVLSGTDQLISQLFFDNNFFYDFLDKTHNIGIDIPIQAGIMPITNKQQIERMTALCKVAIPSQLQEIINRYEYQPQDLYNAGIDYASRQIIDLLEQGVDGIHLYTMNNAQIASEISKNIIGALPRKQIIA